MVKLRGLADPVRSLEQARDDARNRLRQLPLGDRRRGALAMLVVNLEDEIDRRAPAVASPES